MAIAVLNLLFSIIFSIFAEKFKANILWLERTENLVNLENGYITSM